jgi:FtsH-binding integral membrane protein
MRKDFSKLLFDKKEFLIMVFFNLIVQLGITYYVMEKMSTTTSRILLTFIMFGLLLFTALVPMPLIFKFMLTCVFSFVSGLLYSGIKQQYSTTQINAALDSALILFGSMLSLGLVMMVSGLKLTPQLGIFLFICLLLLIIARVLTIVTGVTQFNKVLTVITIILFSTYIVYDTYRILQRDYYGDFLTASLDYYLDILNLFTASLDSH